MAIGRPWGVGQKALALVALVESVGRDAAIFLVQAYREQKTPLVGQMGQDAAIFLEKAYPEQEKLLEAALLLDLKKQERLA
jgi:hypothetical protein